MKKDDYQRALAEKDREIVELRKRLEGNQKARRQEEFHEQIVAADSDLIARFDKNLVLRFVNPAIKRYTALEPSDLIGTDLSRLEWTPVARKIWENNLQGTFDDGSERRFHFKWPSASNGDDFYVTLFPELNASSEVESVHCHVKNITDLVRAHEEHIQHLTKYRTLVEHSLDAVTIIDDKGNYTEVNARACQLFGYSEEELLSMNMLDIERLDKTKKEAKEKLQDFFKKQYQSGEFEFRSGDGQRRIALYNAVHVGPDLNISTLIDVTEERKAQEKLQETQELLNLAIDGGRIGTFDTNLQTGENRTNNYYLESLGYREGEIPMTFDFFMTLVHPDDIPRIQKAFENHLAGRTDRFDVQLRLKAKNGNYHWFIDQAKMVERDQQGNPLRIAGVMIDISWVKKAENELKKVKQRLELAIDGGNIGIWSLNLNTLQIAGNQQINSIVGRDWSTAATPLQSIWKVLHPDDQKKIKAAAQDHIANRTSHLESEIRVLDTDEQYKTLLCRGKIIKWSASGQPLELSGTCLDISEVKRAEQMRQEAEFKYEHLVENVPVLFWIADADGVIKFHNQASKDFLGDLPLEIAPESGGQFFHPDDIVPLRNAAGKGFTTKSPYQLDARLKSKEGKYQWFRINGFPVFDNKRKLSAWYGFSVNIHQTYLANKKLEENEKRLRTITENVDEIIYLRSPGKYELINPKANELWIKYLAAFGVSEEKLRKKQPAAIDGEQIDALLAEAIHPEDLSFFRYAMQRFQDTYEPLDLKFRMILDGEVHWFWTRNVFLNKKDRLEMGIVKDITELKETEMELREANHELDSFVYRVSHDLRSPLASSLGLVNLMHKATTREEHAKLIRLQENSLIKMDNFISDILDYSRNARKEVAYSKIDLKTFLVDIIQESKRDHDVDINLSLEQNISLVSDPLRLSIISRNLIFNAVKYSDPRKQKPYVKIFAQVDNSSLQLKIEDNGIGIAEEHQAKIYNMFYRATDRNSGSGIGLYIAREAVFKLGGKIFFDSTFAKGTTFTVIIPNRGKKEPAS